MNLVFRIQVKKAELAAYACKPNVEKPETDETLSSLTANLA